MTSGSYLRADGEHQHLTDEQLRDFADALDDADIAQRMAGEIKDCSRCLRAYRSLARDHR